MWVRVNISLEKYIFFLYWGIPPRQPIRWKLDIWPGWFFFFMQPLGCNINGPSDFTRANMEWKQSSKCRYSKVFYSIIKFFSKYDYLVDTGYIFKDWLPNAFCKGVPSWPHFIIFFSDFENLWLNKNWQLTQVISHIQLQPEGLSWG